LGLCKSQPIFAWLAGAMGWILVDSVIKVATETIGSITPYITNKIKEHMDK
jgi:hypothetical protein